MRFDTSAMISHPPSLSPQPWPWPAPRVLVEHADAEAVADVVAALRGGGFAVAVCPGPEHGSHCPLTAADGCAAAQGADVVVSWRPLATPQAREALAALRRQFPDTPVLLVTAPGDAADWPELVAGAAVVDDASPGRILDGVLALRREAAARA